MSHQRDDDLIGKIQEKTGWLTGDREAEAGGKLRRLRAARGDDDPAAEVDDDEAEQVADEAERDLRQAYGEYDPAADDEPTAPDERPVD